MINGARRPVSGNVKVDAGNYRWSRVGRTVRAAGQVPEMPEPGSQRRLSEPIPQAWRDGELRTTQINTANGQMLASR
jgi:hypothetical protein